MPRVQPGPEGTSVRSKLLGLLLVSGAIAAGASYAAYTMLAQKLEPIAAADRPDTPASDAYKERLADRIVEKEETRAAVSDMQRKWRQDEMNEAAAAKR